MIAQTTTIRTDALARRYEDKVRRQSHARFGQECAWVERACRDSKGHPCLVRRLGIVRRGRVALWGRVSGDGSVVWVTAALGEGWRPAGRDDGSGISDGGDQSRDQGGA